MNGTPWDDCKIAFGVEGKERIWRWSETAAYKRDMPANWALCETDCSGARCVAIFRVEGIPTVADGQRVAALVKRVDAPQSRRRAA